jgi:uncharacterized protein YbbK (DUF523 family)
MILVSKCLLGENCKYNGKNNKSDKVAEYLKDKAFIGVCPEVMGGLKTPRRPAEICFGSGEDVISKKAAVINDRGENCTGQYLKGAARVLGIAHGSGATLAILKENSPSCGCHSIYNGEFSGKTKKGCGVTTSLLRKHGISVISEEELEKHR